MKIDTNTLNIMKNFSKINPSIFIQEGNTLKTISTSKTIMAKANVTTEFDKSFAIYNLDRLISTLSLFQDPNLDLTDEYIEIKENNRKLKYFYCNVSNITKAPEKEINLPSIDVSFHLKNEDLKDVERALGVLQLPEIVVIGEKGKINLYALDSKNPTSDNYFIEIGETDKNFKAIFKSENIKIIPGDYDVSISSRGISHFVGNEAEYWIAVEQHSVF